MERWNRSECWVHLATGRSSFLVLVGLLTLSCVDIQGGAVEVAWAIFDSNGRAINDCACAVEPPIGNNLPGNKSIAFVRLDLVSSATGDTPCAGLGFCRFACGRRIGATPFIIPAGQYQMSLTPLAADATELSIGSTPPVSRDVVVGQPTELQAFEFMAGCASSCNGGSATQPCTGG